MMLIGLLLLWLSPSCFGFPEQIPGPASPSAWPAWLQGIKQQRDQMKKSINYTGEVYERIPWSQRSYIQPQMMAHDLFFFDPERYEYTVHKYVKDVTDRYGGIDSVLIWPSYPNMGIDNRNQFDLLLSMPGGVPGIRKAVEDFHSHGIRVMFPYNPWDTGTRREKDTVDVVWSKLAHEIGFDGLFGDTMNDIDQSIYNTSVKTKRPLALEPEMGPSLPGISWQGLSWGYWNYPYIPSVGQMKWLDARHMTHVCWRWNVERTDELQFAFFNGVGYESWENVWGIWVPITEYYGESIRRIAKILRTFNHHFTNQSWEPHTPTIQNNYVFSSKFPSRDDNLWVFVNRGKQNLTGNQIEVDFVSGAKYFDLYHGTELTPSWSNNGKVMLSFPIEARGYGALMQRTTVTDHRFLQYLKEMQIMTKRPLESYSSHIKILHQKIKPPTPTTPVFATPPGMVEIPSANYRFIVQGVEIEGNEDVQYPWENSPLKQHDHTLLIHRFFIDKYPVTNQDFQTFMKQTNYMPRDTHNFLKDWINHQTYPSGWDKKPVTWVSVQDMQAYAKWAGKRLPYEWEWQYAAQNLTGFKYPWGNADNQRNYPTVDISNDLRAPDDVDAHPAGKSPFGVEDLVGNVWQMTNYYADEHTQFAILRGGSYYWPQGSHWYFPNFHDLGTHAKYLMIGEGYFRAGTLGFRCVKDAL